MFDFAYKQSSTVTGPYCVVELMYKSEAAHAGVYYNSFIGAHCRIGLSSRSLAMQQGHGDHTVPCYTAGDIDGVFKSVYVGNARTDS